MDLVTLPTPTPSTQNRYKVPSRQWSRWSQIARRVFNGTYKAMQGPSTAYMHPDAPPQRRVWWRTVAWNAAWLAADAVDA
jgi:hypothetical protein